MTPVTLWGIFQLACALFWLQFEGRDLTGEHITAEEIRKSITDYEWARIYEMSQDKHLYQHLIDSLFPTIHGEWPPGCVPAVCVQLSPLPLPCLLQATMKSSVGSCSCCLGVCPRPLLKAHGFVGTSMCALWGTQAVQRASSSSELAADGNSCSVRKFFA